MSRLDIPCPQCGMLLTIPDRALLGKKGRCPRCQNKFLLQLPAELIAFQEATETELAKAANDQNRETSTHEERFRSKPRPAATPAAPITAAASAIPEAADRQIESPFDSPVLESPTAAPVRPRRRKRRGKTLPWIVAAVLLAVGGGGLSWWASQARPPIRSSAVARPKGAGSNPQAEQTAAPVQDAGFPLRGNPTKGKPVSLKFVPLGARILIHLRPAELWADNDAAAEFRACLGPLAKAVEEQLKTNCLFTPQNLETVLVAFIPVSRDAFDVAYVVRTAADFKRSDLIQLFNGELVDEPRPHYVGPDRVFLIHDSRTFASAPKSMKETFLDAAGHALDASEGLETLLARSDADRHFSVVAELEDVRNGVPTLAPAKAQKLLTQVVDFFGDDVEAILWSFHLGDPESQANFFSDLVVRNRTTRSTANLEKDLQKRLAKLPQEILDLVLQTHPETVGNTKIVGRFPAMTKVVERSVKVDHNQRQVAFSLELPEIAGP
ncbi:MAG: hypothetical protein EHM42_08750, partial [Planctomycetaceae bacterium]